MSKHNIFLWWISIFRFPTKVEDLTAHARIYNIVSECLNINTLIPLSSVILYIETHFIVTCRNVLNVFDDSFFYTPYVCCFTWVKIQRNAPGCVVVWLCGREGAVLHFSAVRIPSHGWKKKRKQACSKYANETLFNKDGLLTVRLTLIMRATLLNRQQI